MKNTSMITDAETLRSHLSACSPDARTSSLGIKDSITGQPRSITLEDQHRYISRFVLNEGVPQNIQIHFETAKNCYLYAWFVFRFYQVAEQHAFATLEFALRERFPEFVIKIEKKSRFGAPPSLGSLLKHAVHQKVLRNELFPSRLIWAQERARERFANEIHTQMIKSGLNEITFDDSNIEAGEEDLTVDWLANFIEYIPNIRNNLAHGSSNLHHGVLHTFDVVNSMINMMFPND